MQRTSPAPPGRAAAPSRIWAGVAWSRSRPRTTSVTPWRRSSTTTQNAVGPVAVPVADGQVAARRRPRRRRGPSRPSIHVSEPAPSATRSTGPSRPARGSRPGSRCPATAGRAPRPGRERRPRAVAAVDEAVGAQPLRGVGVGGQRIGSVWRTGPASATNPSQARSSSDGRVELRPGARSRRGPRCAAAPAPRPPRPRPRPTPRWRRARGAGSPSAPARTGSARRAAGRADR